MDIYAWAGTLTPIVCSILYGIYKIGHVRGYIKGYSKGMDWAVDQIKSM